MLDPGALTTEQLTHICRRLGAQPESNRKADKAAAIAEIFNDHSRAEGVLGGLSAGARQLLDDMATTGWTSPIHGTDVGLPHYRLGSARAPGSHVPSARLGNPRLAALAELTASGLAGLGDYEGLVWIWVEAWPALNRPCVATWPAPTRPRVIQRRPAEVRQPAVVALFERALHHWARNPPPVLKNGEQRLAKTVIRSTAKKLDMTVGTVDLLARLAIVSGLVLPNEIARSGRGRSMTIDSAWMLDPDAHATWQELSVAGKWKNLITRWTRAADAWDHQLLANRLFVLWELSALEHGSGYQSAPTFARWIEHRHGTLGDERAVADALEDLRVLDVVEREGPVSLTALGRVAIEDFERLDDLRFGGSATAIVQADLTVIAPPDLDPAERSRLASIATLENDAGALQFRLDETAIASTINDGLAGDGACETAESIIEFLETLSSVPVDDVVHRFVTDAAARAEKLAIVDAPSVLIANDPAELAAATRIKPARLTPVAPTVAVSTLPANKAA